MGLILKQWRLFLVGLLLSLGTSVGMLVARKEAWIPPEGAVGEAEESGEEAEVETYREWFFAVGELETLQRELEAERERLREREAALNNFQSKVRNEVSELERMRGELEQLRQSIDSELIVVKENEKRNFRNLAGVYAEMDPDSAVRVLGEMEVETVVKILSGMPSDASARVLSTMASEGDDKTLEQAAMITEALRKLQ